MQISEAPLSGVAYRCGEQLLLQMAAAWIHQHASIVYTRIVFGGGTTAPHQRGTRPHGVENDGGGE